MNASYAVAGRWTVPRPARGLAIAWTLALLTYVVGDGATTLAAVWGAGLVEMNPAVTTATAALGVWGFAALKAFAVLSCLGLSAWGVRRGDGIFAYTPPVGLAILGAIATASNAGLLL